VGTEVDVRCAISGDARLAFNRCRTAGFSDISIDRHQPGRRRVISILAHTT
jgi:hypothetical protein